MKASSPPAEAPIPTIGRAFRVADDTFPIAIGPPANGFSDSAHFDRNGGAGPFSRLALTALFHWKIFFGRRIKTNALRLLSTRTRTYLKSRRCY